MAAMRTTRSQSAAGRAVAQQTLSQADIAHLILPQLCFRSFVALRSTCAGVRAATQLVCEDLIQILERAAALYVSPRFAEGLQLMAAHQPHICWLLQTPALAVVAFDRYDQLITASYHLLQAHLSRLQKLAVSLSLRRTANAISAPEHSRARCMLFHLCVRLGMFTESSTTLQALRVCAQKAVDGLEQLHGSRHRSRAHDGAIAAAHYTLAGFYTYHHRRPELPDALRNAQRHLNLALTIQSRELGAQHVATLCSQLVRAQVMLLQGHTTSCGRLLTQQLSLCQDVLSPGHPLAAKMLAVMARLQLKQGHEAECERLQQQVLSMRRVALGLHHEDTHRSAMDVYTRRRQHVLLDLDDEQAYVEMAAAMDVCFEMLERASKEEGGTQCYALSKSLQGMGELVFQDLVVLARRGLWPRQKTLDLLADAADAAQRLPPLPLPDAQVAQAVQASAAAAAEAAAAAVAEGVGAAAVNVAAATGTGAEAEGNGAAQRDRVVAKLRELRDQLLGETSWPPRLQ